MDSKIIMNFKNTIISVIFLVSLSHTAKVRKPLYRFNDPNIMNLDDSNFDSIVNNPQRDYAIMIQFYLDWCEGCEKYMKAYTSFASNVSQWDRVLKMAAINCAEERNTDYCRSHGMEFPAHKIFNPPVSTKESQANVEESYPLNRVSTIHGLMRVSIEHLTKLSQTGQAPPSWPNLKPISVNSPTELLAAINAGNVPPETFTVLLIEDTEDNLLTRKTILDLTFAPKELVVRRLNKSNQLLQELRSKSNNKEPAIVVVSPERNIEGIRVISMNEIGNEQIKPRERIVSYLTEEYAEKLVKYKPVYMADMYWGLRYSLYKEVTLHPKLNRTQIQTLSRYMTAIHRNFPFDNENPRRFFMRMDQWLRNRKMNKTVGSTEFLAAMKIGNEGFIPQIENCIHCESGYPCSLWLIFHTLTVAEYEKYIRNDTKSKQQPTQFPFVLYAIRDYVRYFYSCSECSHHFGNMTANLENELPYANSSVMWLWQAHNKISKRLTDVNPQKRKPQFPSRAMCPKCYTPSNQPNDSEILNFLVEYYRKDKLVKVRSGVRQNLDSYCTRLAGIVLAVITLIYHLKFD